MKIGWAITLLIFSLNISLGAGDFDDPGLSICPKPKLNNSLNGPGEYFSSLFTTEFWPSRWDCGNWNPTEGWMYIGSDLLIFLSYVAIPFMLIIFMFKKRVKKYKLFVALFGGFILACGLGHLLDAILFWEPLYRLSGFLRIVTALISVSTVFALVKAIPTVLNMKDNTTYEKEVLMRKDSEAVLKNFVRFSPYVSALVGTEQDIKICSKAWEELEDTLLNEETILSLVEVKCAYEKALLGESQLIQESNIKGLNKVFRIESRPYFSSTNQIIGVILFIEDKTERYGLQNSILKKNKDLIETYNLLEETFEMARVGSWMYDSRDNSLQWSKMIYEIHEMDLGSFIDVAKGIDFYHENSRSIISEAFGKAMTEGVSYDLDLQILTQKSKNSVWVRAIGQPVYSEGNIVGVKGLFQDIDSRKSNEIRLDYLNKNLEKQVEIRTMKYKKTNKKLYDALENVKKSQDYIIETEKMASLGQLIAGVAHELNTPMGAIKASVHTMLNNRAYFVSALKYIKSLSLNDFNVLTEALNDKYYQDCYSAREIRQKRKEILKDLENYNVEEKEFIADSFLKINTINKEAYIKYLQADDINALLNIVKPLHSVFMNAERINTAIGKSAKIVYSLKSFSNQQELEEKKDFSITESLDTVLTLYSSQLRQNVYLEKNYQDNPYIKGNPGQIEQVWTNLIHNALQAMQYNGRLELQVSIIDNSALISIRDNGPGIPEAIQEKIFNPFFTTKSKGEGSGLGLDIVKKILQNHNGSVVFTSKAGETVFTVSLPLINKK